MSKTACRMGVVGKAMTLSVNAENNACLVATAVNGAHVFNTDSTFYGDHLSRGLAASSVESYSHEVLGDEPFLSSCFLSDSTFFALGSSNGTIVLASRQSQALVSRYVSSSEDPYRHLERVASHGHQVLACTQRGAEIVDLTRCECVVEFENPAARAVSAVPLGDNAYAVANYDGKVLLYDARAGRGATTVLSIPDQITTMCICPVSSTVVVGTAAGRLFNLRCVTSSVREQAFGTGRSRSPVTSVAMYGHKIAAGDLSGRLALVDISDVPDPTVYWTAETLLSAQVVDPDAANTSAAPALLDACVSATALSKGICWAAFTTNEANSQVVALPA